MVRHPQAGRTLRGPFLHLLTMQTLQLALGAVRRAIRGGT